MRKAPSQPSPRADWDDAKFAISEFGAWIKNADTKTGLLTAALGVSYGAVLGQLGLLASTFKVLSPAGQLLLGVLGLGWVVTSTLAARGAYKSLRPRVEDPEPNRFSWPSVAQMTAAELIEPDTIVSDAWAQARTLAKIARAKYRFFHSALSSFFWSLAWAAVLIGVAYVAKYAWLPS